MSEAFKANLKLTFQNCCFLRREECSSQSNSMKRKKTKGLIDISKGNFQFIFESVKKNA